MTRVDDLLHIRLFSSQRFDSPSSKCLPTSACLQHRVKDAVESDKEPLVLLPEMRMLESLRTGVGGRSEPSTPTTCSFQTYRDAQLWYQDVQP